MYIHVACRTNAMCKCTDTMYLKYQHLGNTLHYVRVCICTKKEGELIVTYFDPTDNEM